MAERLGFHCPTCKQPIFVSTEYFRETTVCPSCQRTVEIPFMIYAWLRPPWPLVALLGFLGAWVYALLNYGPTLGTGVGWLGATGYTVAMFFAINFVRVFIRGPLEVFFYIPYVNRLPPAEQRRFAETGRRARLAASGADDLMLLIPMAVYAATFYLYRWLAPDASHDPLYYIRSPWIFMGIGLVVSVAIGLPTVWFAFLRSMARSR